MIHSLFMINQSGDVFLEKHWKSVISRSIVDYFFDVQNKVGEQIVFFSFQGRGNGSVLEIGQRF